METETARAKKPLHFKNPPIIEAVIALHIVELPSSRLEDFRAIASDLKELGYSLAAPVSQHQFVMKLEDGVSTVGNQDKQLGFRFVSDDQLYVVQFNLSGIIFSRIGPYDKWESFRSEAYRLWEVFSRTTSVPRILQAEVRYINKLFLPIGARNEDYVCVSPQLPDNISNVISGMYMRIELPLNEPSGILIHNQMLLPIEKEGFSTLLMDNDFIFPVEGRSAAQVWELLEQARIVKDEYFEKFTTDKMRDTFNV